MVALPITPASADKDRLWFFFLKIIGHQSVRVGVTETANKVHMAISMMKIALQEITLGRKLNFFPEYKNYLGLGSLGTNPNMP